MHHCKKAYAFSLVSHGASVATCGAPAGAQYKCPGKGCKHTISAKTEAEELAKKKELTTTKLSKVDLIHRNAHAGTHWLKRKLLWLDHVKRAPSLLHMMLNGTSTTLTTALKRGATKEEILALNQVFTEYECGGYEFKTKKGERDPKIPGNTCRKILWTPGLLLALIDARWGKADSAGERQAQREVAEAQAIGQAAGLRDFGSEDQTSSAPPARPTIIDTTKTTVDAASLLAAVMARNLPPPAARPAPQAAASLQPETEEADDEQEEADVGIRFDGDWAEVSPDSGVVGTRATSVKCLLTFLHLLLDLNQPWVSDAAGAEKKIRAKTSSRKGRNWVAAIRTHANGEIGHFYCHIAYAHLEELVLEHGYLQTVNDEVLEKGNRDMKNFRDLTWWGGSSKLQDQNTKVVQTRYRLASSKRQLMARRRCMSRTRSTCSATTHPGLLA